jgi:hypothetical protein
MEAIIQEVSEFFRKGPKQAFSRNDLFSIPKSIQFEK